VTEFGSFDNSTCKRVLDLLEPGDISGVAQRKWIYKYDALRYDTAGQFNMRLEADSSQLNLPHGTSKINRKGKTT